VGIAAISRKPHSRDAAKPKRSARDDYLLNISRVCVPVAVIAYCLTGPSQDF
jgi:hypothetical protein